MRPGLFLWFLRFFSFLILVWILLALLMVYLFVLLGYLLFVSIHYLGSFLIMLVIVGFHLFVLLGYPFFVLIHYLGSFQIVLVIVGYHLFWYFGFADSGLVFLLSCVWSFHFPEYEYLRSRLSRDFHSLDELTIERSYLGRQASFNPTTLYLPFLH